MACLEWLVLIQSLPWIEIFIRLFELEAETSSSLLLIFLELLELRAPLPFV